MHNSPDAERLIAYNSAVVHAYYGEFDQARQRLGIVRQTVATQPYSEALPLLLESLLAFLEQHDFERARDLAYQAQARMKPSWQVNVRALNPVNIYQAYCQLGEVLTDPAQEELFDELEDQARRAPVLIKVFLLWGLAAAYSRSGQAAKAMAKLGQVHEIAPHCQALLRLPANSYP
jgi:tetratricopeptide (TPR) repeat protein